MLTKARAAIAKAEGIDLADQDQFECVQCHNVFDIEDSIQTSEGLKCEQCAKAEGTSK